MPILSLFSIRGMRVQAAGTKEKKEKDITSRLLRVTLGHPDTSYENMSKGSNFKIIAVVILSGHWIHFFLTDNQWPDER